jgi:hypothetical protein
VSADEAETDCDDVDVDDQNETQSRDSVLW